MLPLSTKRSDFATHDPDMGMSLLSYPTNCALHAKSKLTAHYKLTSHESPLYQDMCHQQVFALI